ncbi:TPA: hypothetical protein ACU6GP_005147 [Pseudomonas aeruginosa]
MSKELNKAPVEQAGGDERDLQGTQGERDGWGPFPIVQVPWNVFDRAVMWVEDRRRYGDDGTIVDDWKALKTIQRAALAQPSTVRSSLLINGYQLRAALEFIAPDGTAKQLESEARIEWRQQDADFLEAGLYAWCAEYPEEGCVLLDEEPAAAQPSPAPTTSGYDQLWGWFGLSRSAYAVLPRVMMHAMPDDWQARFAELMDEWDDHWPNQPDITAHVQIKQNNRFISTPPWLLNYRHPDHNQLNAMRGKDEL